MIILRNNIFEKSFALVKLGQGKEAAISMTRLKQLAQQEGVSLTEYVKKLRNNKRYASKVAKKEGAAITSQNPQVVKTQNHSAGEYRKAKNVALQAERQAQGVSLQDVGTANYIQKTTAHRPDVYRNDVFERGVQGMRTRQARAQLAWEAERPVATREQLAQARRAAAEAQRVPLQDVGYARYTESTGGRNPYAIRPSRSVIEANPKVQRMRARQAEAQQAFDASRPSPTREQIVQARRNAAEARGVSLQNVGTARYIQPTQVNAPGVYRNNAFVDPGNVERLNRYRKYASGNVRVLGAQNNPTFLSKNVSSSSPGVQRMRARQKAAFQATGGN